MDDTAWNSDDNSKEQQAKLDKNGRDNMDRFQEFLYKGRSLFSQPLNQLSDIQSNEPKVSIAVGGDHQFPFNPKMTRDEMHGNSGLFRYFYLK